MKYLGNFQISGIGDSMETNAIHCDRGIMGLGRISLKHISFEKL